MQKKYYKFIGATTAAILFFVASSLSVNFETLQGKLVLKHEINEQISLPVSMVVTEKVKPGEEVEIELVDANRDFVNLPKNWEIDISYFPESNIESIVASTEKGFANDHIKERKGVYIFNAPQIEALYKVTIRNEESKTVISQLKVQK